MLKKKKGRKENVDVEKSLQKQFHSSFPNLAKTPEETEMTTESRGDNSAAQWGIDQTSVNHSAHAHYTLFINVLSPSFSQ